MPKKKKPINNRCCGKVMAFAMSVTTLAISKKRTWLQCRKCHEYRDFTETIK